MEFSRLAFAISTLLASKASASGSFSVTANTPNSSASVIVAKAPIWICGGSRSARSSSGRARRAAVSVAAQCGECAKRRRVRAAANCCAEP